MFSDGQPVNKGSESSMKVEETSPADEDDQMLTPTANNTLIAPLEELQNIAGGNDIKVHNFLFFRKMSLCESVLNMLFNQATPRWLTHFVSQGLEAALDKAVQLDDDGRIRYIIYYIVTIIF